MEAASVLLGRADAAVNNSLGSGFGGVVTVFSLAFTVRSILLLTKVLVLAALVAKAFGGMATVLLILVTLADSTESLAGADGSFGTFKGAEALVGFAAGTWGASEVPVPVLDVASIDGGVEASIGATLLTVVAMATSPTASTRGEAAAVASAPSATSPMADPDSTPPTFAFNRELERVRATEAFVGDRRDLGALRWVVMLVTEEGGRNVLPDGHKLKGD